MENLLETITFSKEFVSHPLRTSSIIPSSKKLSHTILSMSNIFHARTIFEFGCGTGAITKEIIKKSKNATIFSFDINRRFTEFMRRKYPAITVINDSAENAKKYMEKFHILNIDLIISSLPWAAFSEKLQQSLIDEIYEILKLNGEFLTYTYIHTEFLYSHKSFIKKLQEKPWLLEFSPTIWLNIPPAFVIKCRKIK